MQTTGESLPFTLTETDRKVLALSDEEFTPHDWEDLTSIIGRVLFSSFLHVSLLLFSGLEMP